MNDSGTSMEKLLQEITHLREKTMELEQTVARYRKLEEELKEAEQRRKLAEQALAHADSLSVIGQLAAGVAHEIRNPLATLKGFIQLLQAGLYKKEYFDILLSELDRIQFIVDQFLQLAKPQQTEFTYHNPVELMNDIIALLTSQANLCNVTIHTEYLHDVPLIQCDQRQLKQVFLNLLKNAIEAMPDGGNIVVTIKRSENELLIRIADEGCGIAPDQLAKLGEPFYSTKEKGMGLGLMVCYRIIENHGGTIRVESEVGKGTTFSIFLPL